MIDIELLYEKRWDMFCNDGELVIRLVDKIEIGSIRFVYKENKNMSDVWDCDIFINDLLYRNFCVSFFSDTEDIEDDLLKLAYCVFYDPPESIM